MLVQLRLEDADFLVAGRNGLEGGLVVLSVETDFGLDFFDLGDDLVVLFVGLVCFLLLADNYGGNTDLGGEGDFSFGNYLDLDGVLLEFGVVRFTFLTLDGLLFTFSHFFGVLFVGVRSQSSLDVHFLNDGLVTSVGDDDSLFLDNRDLSGDFGNFDFSQLVGSLESGLQLFQLIVQLSDLIVERADLNSQRLLLTNQNAGVNLSDLGLNERSDFNISVRFLRSPLSETNLNL